MLQLYKSDQRVVDFITQFFKVRRGVRCVSFQNRLTKTFWRYGYHKQKALTTLTTDNFMQKQESAKGLATFFYEPIFDPIVMNPGVVHYKYMTDTNTGKYIRDKKGKPKLEILHNQKVIGLSMIFEIDCPASKTGSKLNMFDTKMYDEVMELKLHVEKELDDVETEYGEIFSGNGFYFKTKIFYCDEEEMNYQELRDIRQDIIDDMQLFVNTEDKPYPVIDSRDLGWANYFKIPFTFHEIKDILTIPVQKGYIDREWLYNATNLNLDSTLSKENITNILDRHYGEEK